MKTPERFKRALKALVQAFFNDTLAKGDCTMCAVGNICGGLSDWSYLFSTHNGYQTIRLNYKEHYVVMKNISDTGYVWEELARVEFAFETNTLIDSGDYDKHTKQEIMEDQYRGLMAVVEVLCEIEGLDCTPYKEAFEYNSELQPINNL